MDHRGFRYGSSKTDITDVTGVRRKGEVEERKEESDDDERRGER